ncbi:MAG: glutathione S-transferase N-terminal domain-containing protein [Cyanobacteria bacterium P01_D01_bin.105]
MKLVGLFDSPYVRRVAVSLHHLDINFDHAPLSVFHNVDEFSDINPLIKAPTLITNSHEVLMDSTLILEYVEKLSANNAGASLMPADMTDYQQALRLIGLAINACDKSVQIEYERKLRPAEKFHQPWIDRVKAQLESAYELMEVYAQETSGWMIGDRLTQADITVSIAWQFTHFMVPEYINSAQYPGVAALSARAEKLPAFQQCPLEPGWQARL